VTTLSPTQERLRQLLAAPRYARLRAYLETRTRVFRRATDVVFEPAPGAATASWRPSASFVVVTEPIEIAGNIVTGADDGSASTLILLGGLRAANVLNSPDTAVFCGGPCVVAGLLFAAMPDAAFVTTDVLEAGVVYSGHSNGCVTALGPTVIDVLDDYVEGPDEETEVVATRAGVRACDVVVSALLDTNGKLDHEATLERFTDTRVLVRRG